MSQLISIIVPVYKTEKYLDKCVESIVSQTYTNLEIILVDDGSPDNCPKMCDEWAEKDNRIKVIHKVNDGLANARNSGIEMCTGDYVMFVDSDDYIELDMAEFLLDLILKNNSDISRCGLVLSFENGNTKKYENNNLIYPSKNELLIDLINENYNGGIVCNKLYKTSLIKKVQFEKKDGASEDIMFNYKVYALTQKVVFYDIPKYHYVIRSQSITNSEFSEGAFSILRAKQFMLNDQRENYEVIPYFIRGYVVSAFIVLSGVISNQKCLDKYDDLRKSILKYKKEILFSNI